MSKIQTFSESGKGRPVTAVSSLTSRELNEEGPAASTEAPPAIDLSKCLHLTATVTRRKNLNNTGLYFVAIGKGTPRADGEPDDSGRSWNQITLTEQKPKQENRGGRRERKADGLTGRGKSVLKIIGDCYNKLVTEPEFFEQWKYEAFHRWFDQNKDKDFDQGGEVCRLRDFPFPEIERMFADHWGLADGNSPFDTYNRFITLTFRTNEFTKGLGLVPDDMAAKKLLDSFLKRLRRHKGRNIHYTWVAERQKNGTIHFHILTPERLMDRGGRETTKRYFRRESAWINQHWNETVMSWAYRAKAITREQRDAWQEEMILSEGYYRELAEWKYNGGKKPAAPKAKFLLCPNLTWAMNAGHYMAKYMSKQGQNIAGGMYDASQESRVFLRTETEPIASAAPALCNAVIKRAALAAREQKVYARYFEMWNGAVGLWCADMEAMEPIFRAVLKHSPTVKINTQDDGHRPVKTNPAIIMNDARRRFELAPEDFDDGTDFEPQNQDHEKQALPF